MDVVDGRPGHMALQFGHLNASSGAPVQALSLSAVETTKKLPAKPLLVRIQGLSLPCLKRNRTTGNWRNRRANKFVSEENDYENVSGK